MDINRVVERGIELCHRVAPAELNGQRLRIIPQTHLLGQECELELHP